MCLPKKFFDFGRKFLDCFGFAVLRYLLDCKIPPNFSPIKTFLLALVSHAGRCLVNMLPGVLEI